MFFTVLFKKKIEIAELAISHLSNMETREV